MASRNDNHNAIQADILSPHGKALVGLNSEVIIEAFIQHNSSSPQHEWTPQAAAAVLEILKQKFPSKTNQFDLPLIEKLKNGIFHAPSPFPRDRLSYLISLISHGLKNPDLPKPFSSSFIADDIKYCFSLSAAVSAEGRFELELANHTKAVEMAITSYQDAVMNARRFHRDLVDKVISRFPDPLISDYIDKVILQPSQQIDQIFDDLSKMPPDEI